MSPTDGFDAAKNDRDWLVDKVAYAILSRDRLSVQTALDMAEQMVDGILARCREGAR